VAIIAVIVWFIVKKANENSESTSENSPTDNSAEWNQIKIDNQQKEK